jgi:methyl-accepting chemotaxis protein
MNIKNIALVRKFGIGFLPLILITILVGVGGLISILKINNRTFEIEKSCLPSNKIIHSINVNINEIQLLEVKYILHTDNEDKKNIEDLIFDNNLQLNENLKQIKTLIESDDEQKLFEEFSTAWHLYLEASEQALKLSNQNQTDSAKNLILSMLYYKHLDVQKSLKALMDFNSDEFKYNVEQVDKTYKNTRNALVLIIIIAFIISTFLSGHLAKSILMDVGGEPSEVARIASEVAKGNLVVDFDKSKKLQGIYGSVIQMSLTLREMIAKIQDGADRIARAGEQLSSVSEELSQGANNQASTVEEISSSMEEISVNIQQNSKNAIHTESISLTAAQGISKVKKASSESNESVKQIADKIRIINDIAFQTNILALNAAVESARAGEHGRGFAIVAAEVRKLAEHSKVAAAEINALASKSVNATIESFSLLEQIIPHIDKTSSLLKEITSASKEQSIGTEQINNAIQGLNQTTQQNAIVAEKLAVNADDMLNQAENLKDTIAFFRTKNG